MFEEGTVIYFDPFFFKNGNTAKPKYFVVLRVFDGNTVLASLPTRSDSVPQKDEVDSGCVELPDINLNCFVIAKDVVATECGKCFEFKTHLYGHQLDVYEVDFLQEIYPIEGTDYVIWGKLKKDIFNLLMDCLINSKSVKRKYRNILSA